MRSIELRKLTAKTIAHTPMGRFQRGNGMAATLLLIAVAVSALLSRAMVESDSTQATQLQHAKHALLAYATNYQDFYSVRSAGPGHLPCPDTDLPGASTGNYLPIETRIPDGPNPPCGNSRLAIGLLPRKIQFDDERLFFQAVFGRRAWYAVSTDFINNPTNRTINFSRLHSVLAPQPVASLVSLPEHIDATDAIQWVERLHTEEVGQFDSSMPNRSVAVLKLYPKELVHSVSTRVAQWFVEQLQQAAAARCSAQTPPCTPFQPELCEQNVSAPQEYRGRQLLLWLNQEPEHFGCQDSSGASMNGLVSESIDSDAQHWFMRNQWIDDFALRVTGQCHGAGLGVCQFVYSGIDEEMPALIFELIAGEYR